MRSVLMILLAVSVLFIYTGNAFSVLIVDVMDIIEGIEDAGDEIASSIILSHDDEDDVSFSMSLKENNFGQRVGPRRDDRGDPDEMGYQWRDDDEDDGPEYEWIDITEEEDVVDIDDLQDDTICDVFELPFDFEFYGNIYNELAIYPNGYAAFQGDNGIEFFYPWPDLPSDNYNPPPPPNLLLVAYQDLNPFVEDGGNIYYWADRNQVICTWENIPHFDDPTVDEDLWTFQIILNRFDNSILFQYKDIGLYDVDPNQLSIMVGFQNEDQDMGFTIMRDDEDYLDAEMCIAIGSSLAFNGWLDVEPKFGTIEPDSEQEIEITLSGNDLEAGVYAVNLEITADGDQDMLIIPIVFSIASEIGSIAGMVTSAEDDEPVAGADISIDPFGITRVSDEDGNYRIDNLPADTYSLVCTAEGFLPYSIAELEVVDGEDTDGSIELLHGEFEIADLQDVNVELPSDTLTVSEFIASNGGTGPVEFSVEKRLRGGNDFEPWEERATINATQETEDDRLWAVTFADGKYYIAGQNRPDEPQIYVLDHEGNFEGSFVQLGEGARGMLGLTWDGTLLWGSGESTIFGFNTDGEEEISFDGPMRSNNNFLAWDPVDSLIWVCSTTSANIVATDREGNVSERELDRLGMRIYGLAYWKDDPDGYNLYIIHDIDDTQNITKMNTVTNDTLHVISWDADQGRAGDIHISNEWDVYNWVLMTVPNIVNADVVNIWQLDAREDWFNITPILGGIPAGEDLQFDLTLSTISMPGGNFEGQLIFRHNGRGDDLMLNIDLTVIPPEPPNEPPSSFNIISPEDNAVLYDYQDIEFTWQASIDPNMNDTVGYEVWLMSGELSTSFFNEDTAISIAAADIAVELELSIEEEFSVFWNVLAVSGEDSVWSDSTNHFTWQPNSVKSKSVYPHEFAIISVHPNPFNSYTTVQYSLDNSGKVDFMLMDNSGRVVMRKNSGVLPMGYHELILDADQLPSGVYLLRINSKGRILTSKIVAIK